MPLLVIQGYAVSLPIAETVRYDLIVDIEGLLFRVEVKTTTRANGETALATKGGRNPSSGVKRISSKDCDLVFIVNLTTGTICEYKAIDLENRTTIRVR